MKVPRLILALHVKVKFWLILLSFLGALMDEAGGWLIRFVHPLLAYVKIAGFLLLQGTLAVLIVAVLWAVLGNARKAYTDDLQPPLEE